MGGIFYLLYCANGIE